MVQYQLLSHFVSSIKKLPYVIQ